MGALAVKTLRIAARSPLRLLPQVITEGSTMFRRCLIPLAVSQTLWLWGFGVILFGTVVSTLGAVDRYPGGIWIAWLREVATWVSGMIFAGVAAGTVTADLGARKIREELDALAVLGVDRLRALVVPRVIAMTIAAPMLMLLSMVMVELANYVLTPRYLAVTPGVFKDSVTHVVLPIDLWAALLKNAVIGFFVGIVSCHKGLSCEGGTEGVGRAVNQAVVICFFGIWLFDSLFELGYLTLFPQTAVLRG
jgi:phospholipid/cholesterol/gamma-HCH transport system permease protein